MPVSLNLRQAEKYFGVLSVRGLSPLFNTTVPRNVGSVMSVNDHKHFKDRLTI